MRKRDGIGGAIGLAVFAWAAGFALVAFWARAPWRHLGHRRAAAASAQVDAAPPPRTITAPIVTAVVPARHNYNVLLLTIDTLRFDLGFMGYPRPVTPNLDALAERSTVFERAYATASFTPRSVGPMMIGRYASETDRDAEHYTTYAASNVFVAERARSAGVLTFAGMCHRYFTLKNGLDQGFGIWDTSATPPNAKDDEPRPTSKALSDVALRLLTEQAFPGAHFFAWFHYVDPHAPYVPHPGAPDFGKGVRSLYDQEVWFTDANVGRVLDYVAAQPWGANTAIIVSADHGEAFGEHGFWRHGRELWEPLVRVPLIVFVPGAKPKRITVKRSHIDLVPTILDLLGVPLPEGDTIRGTSLTSDIVASDDDLIDERDIYFDMPAGPFNEMRRAIITGTTPGTKLVDFGGQKRELYDLGADPGETKNLVSDVERLHAVQMRLDAFRARLHEVPPH